MTLDNDAKQYVQDKLARKEKAKTDFLYLANVLGYHFQDDVHADLFAQFFKVRKGVAMPNLSEMKNFLILWPRGHYKTSAIEVFIVHIILNMPDVRILIMSANVKLTKQWMAIIKGHFTGKNPQSKLLELFPKLRLVEKGNSLAFTVPTRTRQLKNATVSVASPKAVETGSHFDFLFADDLVNTTNYRNTDLQDKLEEDFNHFVPLLDPGGYTIVTGTRYSPSDVYGRIIKRGGSWHQTVKASYDQNGVMLFPQRTIEHFGETKVIGFTREQLDQFEKDDQVTFNAQYMNRIFTANRQTFPRELIYGCTRSTKHEGYPRNFSCYFSVDLAESAKSEADHSVIAIGRRDANGATWVEDVVGSNWTPSQFATVLLNKVIEKRPERIFIQKASGAETFAALLRVLAQQYGIEISIELVKISNQKDAKFIRISALEGEFRNNRLFLSAGIRDFERLEEEFTQFPKGRHDDRPDAIATLVGQLNHAMPVFPRMRILQGGLFGVPGEEPEQVAGQNMLGFGFVC